MKKIASLLLATAGWFAVVAQFILMRQNSLLPLAELTWRFFSYFTILSNILVAIRFTTITVGKEPSFFTRAGVQTALTVYIMVVGVVYNVVLRFLWSPQGLQFVVDELLHTIIPLASVLFWWKYVPKKELRYNQTFYWMLFPLGYILFVAVSGTINGFYPYPFINVTVLGYPRALLNGLGLMMIFIGLGLFLIAVAQWSAQPQRSRK